MLSRGLTSANVTAAASLARTSYVCPECELRALQWLSVSRRRKINTPRAASFTSSTTGRIEGPTKTLSTEGQNLPEAAKAVIGEQNGEAKEEHGAAAEQRNPGGQEESAVLRKMPATMTKREAAIFRQMLRTQLLNSTKLPREGASLGRAATLEQGPYMAQTMKLEQKLLAPSPQAQSLPGRRRPGRPKKVDGSVRKIISEDKSSAKPTVKDARNTLSAALSDGTSLLDPVSERDRDPSLSDPADTISAKPLGRRGRTLLLRKAALANHELEELADINENVAKRRSKKTADEDKPAHLQGYKVPKDDSKWPGEHLKVKTGDVVLTRMLFLILYELAC